MHRMPSYISVWLYGFIFVLTYMPLNLSADDNVVDGKWQQKFKADLNSQVKFFKAMSDQNPNKFVIAVGNKVWHKGKKFSSSRNWLGLYCANSNCQWVPASLKVKQETMSVGWGKYDAGYEKLRGQILTFETKEPQFNEGVLFWILKKPRLPQWLKTNEVKTFYAASSISTEIDNKSQIFEKQFNDQKDGIVKIIPKKMIERNEGLNQYGETFLQLVDGDKTEFFLSGLSIDECSVADVNAVPNYLLWAGDIDRDGRTDYLMGFSINGSHAHLYLSNNSQTNKLLKLAGLFDARQSQTGCF